MANTYTWLVDSLDCFPSADGQTNVVCNVHWRVDGSDGTHNVTTYGNQPLTYTSGNSFIAYSNLTLETVTGWVKAALGDEKVNTIQSMLDTQISNLVNQPNTSPNIALITPVLPWKLA